MTNEIIELTPEEVAQIAGCEELPATARSEQYPEIENIPP